MTDNGHDDVDEFESDIIPPEPGDEPEDVPEGPDDDDEPGVDKPKRVRL